MEDWDCAMFVSQHCSANIKASAQSSSLKFKERLLRNQVEALALNLEKTREQSSSSARQTQFRLNQTIGMKIHSIDVCLKTLQCYGN